MSARRSARSAALLPEGQRTSFQAPTRAALTEATRQSRARPASASSPFRRRSIRNLARAGVFIVAAGMASVTALPAYAMMPTGTNPVASTVNAGQTFVDTSAPATQTLDVNADAQVAALSATRDSYNSTDASVLQAQRDAEAAAAQAAADAVAAAAKAVETASTPSGPKTFAPPQGGYSGEAVVAYAEQFVGVVPYGWGADPNDSFGCDGLTQYVYGQFGISLPRGVDHQAALATRITQDEAVAGDLVVWPGEHIGIYDGAGGVIHSPDFGRYVEHAHSLWGSPVFYRL
ncbi:C40 family peptidase [Agreia bicolorata]|uniref:C40 family peptidase n=1 Tax=Agreia bicolorata TaxID=110935 RepID=UPI000A06CF25|nr:NlpC/P60 family protein [Agreia bicolorata]